MGVDQAVAGCFVALFVLWLLLGFIRANRVANQLVRFSKTRTRKKVRWHSWKQPK